MPAVVVVSSSAQIGTRPGISLAVPVGAVRAVVRVFMSDADAVLGTTRLSYSARMKFPGSQEWVNRDCERDWVGSPPRFPELPPSKPNYELSWDTGHPPSEVAADLEQKSAVVMGMEVEFFDAQGNSLTVP